MPETVTQSWGFLTNHALIMIYVIRHSGSTVRQISEGVRITDRATLAILRQLSEDGIVERHRDGRKNTYAVNFDKLAAYRDEKGALHVCQARCPHLGCVVHWNPAEVTWDCPCHGSRFDPYGKVINGPANRDLAPAGRSQEQRAA